MKAIFDTGALVRPAFAAADFAPTKWDSGDDKAKFANDLCRFMAADFGINLFTETLYRRLATTFGHMAHFGKVGFIDVFFGDLRGKVDFIEQTSMWRPCGDPAWTWSDVERAVLARLDTVDLLSAYRSMRAAEVEGAERELLRRLQEKYAGSGPPLRAPIPHCPVAPKANPPTREPAGQASLF